MSGIHPRVFYFSRFRLCGIFLVLGRFICRFSLSLSSFRALYPFVIPSRTRVSFIPLSDFVYLHWSAATSLALYQLLRSPRGLGYQLTPVNKGVARGKCLSANGSAASKRHDNVWTNRVLRTMLRVTGQSAGASVGPHEVMTRDQHIIHR